MNNVRQVRQRDAQSTTLMLVVVIGVFLCTETPLMVITALHTLSNRLPIISILKVTSHHCAPILVNDCIIVFF